MPQSYLEKILTTRVYEVARESALDPAPALSKRGSIQVERRTNSLVITDLASNLDDIVKMATELDSTTPQIEITAKLVDVDASASHAIGIENNNGPRF